MTQQVNISLESLGRVCTAGSLALHWGHILGISRPMGQAPSSRLLALCLAPLWALSVECISLTFAFVYFSWRKWVYYSWRFLINEETDPLWTVKRNDQATMRGKVLTVCTCQGRWGFMLRLQFYWRQSSSANAQLLPVFGCLLAILGWTFNWECRHIFSSSSYWWDADHGNCPPSPVQLDQCVIPYVYGYSDNWVLTLWPQMVTVLERVSKP